MAWPNKEKTPEELFKEMFGMSKEEYEAQRADELKAVKDSLADEQTKRIETEISLSSLRAELDSLKAPKADPERKQPTNFFENPDQAFNERMAPLAVTAMQTAGSLEEMKARIKYEREFKRWGSELEELAKGDHNIQNRTNPQFWENVVNVVRGRHAAEIEQSALKGTAFFTEQPGGGAVGGAGEDKDFGLSREQLSAAKRMGMEPKEFKEALDYTMNNYGHTKGASYVH